MFSRTKIVLSAALILGTASVALAANEHDDSVSEGQAMREMHGNPLPWWWNSSEQARSSLAYQAVEPSRAKPQPKGRAVKHQ